MSTAISALHVQALDRAAPAHQTTIVVRDNAGEFESIKKGPRLGVQPTRVADALTPPQSPKRNTPKAPLRELRLNAAGFLGSVKIDVARDAGQVTYNAGLACYRGQYVLLYRVDGPYENASESQQIAITALDNEFRAQGRPTIFHASDDAVPSDEDPRLVVFRDTLYAVFNAKGHGGRTMRIAPISMQGTGETATFLLGPVKEMRYRDGDADFPAWEKNWAPFCVDDSKLCFVYRTNPPLTISIDAAELEGPGESLHPRCLARAEKSVPWPYGEMRGGTPALYDKALDKLVAMFHSRQHLSGPLGEKSYYVQGLYAFAPQAPFDITHMTQQPIVVEEFYDEADSRLQVIFPQGLVIEDDRVLVSYGKNDREMRIATYNRRALYAELELVKPEYCDRQRVSQNGKSTAELAEDAEKSPEKIEKLSATAAPSAVQM